MGTSIFQELSHVKPSSGVLDLTLMPRSFEIRHRSVRQSVRNNEIRMKILDILIWVSKGESINKLLGNGGGVATSMVLGIFTWPRGPEKTL